MDLAQVADRIAITDVITAYTRAVDTADWGALNAVFTEDAVIDYSSAGGPIGTLVELDNHSLREAQQTAKPSEFLAINAGNQR